MEALVKPDAEAPLVIMEMIVQNISNSSANGTVPGEVFLVTFFVPVCSMLSWLAAIVFSLPHWSYSYMEMIVLNLVLLFVLTLLNNSLSFLIVILETLLVASLTVAISFYSWKEINQALRSLKNNSTLLKEFNKDLIGDYRGHLLLATSICILAVDFKIFPTRFAKTETFGWSVMDAGVGSFVLLHGLCSSHGKSLSSQNNGIKKCFLSSFPLFILGLSRLALTSAVGYHKVVPEYGVHWNFFFTLALTKVIGYCILKALKNNIALLAVTSIAIHQYLLSKANLSALVLSEHRRNLFEENKEGICSLLGFISLYFFGVQMGQIIWIQRQKVLDYIFLLLQLCGIGLCGWILMYVTHEHIQPISRRMANLTYCIWVVTLTSLQIAVHLCHRLVVIICDKIFKTTFPGILLWKMINFNGLFYFLLANLLTGLVNLTINTNDASILKSTLILTLYLTILTLFSIIMYRIKMKSF